MGPEKELGSPMWFLSGEIRFGVAVWMPPYGFLPGGHKFGELLVWGEMVAALSQGDVVGETVSDKFHMLPVVG